MNKEAIRELRNLATTTAHTAAAARQHATTVATGCGCVTAAAELLRGAVLTSLAAAEAIAAEIATGDPATERGAELATLVHDLEGVTGRARLSGRMLGWLIKNVPVNRVWVISTIQHACAEEYDARMPRIVEKLERLRSSDWTEPGVREAADRIAGFTPAQ